MNPVRGSILLVAAFAFACGGTVEPSPVDAGSDGATGDPDGSSADAGLAPIPCGDRTCAGATPYCLMAATCGFGPTECTTPTSDAGAWKDTFGSGFTVERIVSPSGRDLTARLRHHRHAGASRHTRPATYGGAWYPGELHWRDAGLCEESGCSTSEVAACEARGCAAEHLVSAQ